MPSKYPVLKPAEIIRKLARKDFKFVSQKGSHAKYSNGVYTCIIPLHDEVQKGTLKNILNQAHIELEEFVKL